LLITEDHDFGEWVFAHHEPTWGVVFLRYRHSEYQRIALSLVKVLQKYSTLFYDRFTVVTVTKVRMRRI